MTFSDLSGKNSASIHLDDRIQIFVVEEIPEDAGLYLQMLIKMNLSEGDITHHPTMEKAVYSLKDHQPDLILFGINRPETNVLSSFRTLSDSAEDIPIIVLGDSNDTQLMLQVIEAGAQDYLVKGNFSGSDLYRSIRFSIERQNRLLKKMRAERELQKENQSLLQQSRTKSEFLSNMSHELRSPLNSVIILSQHLRDNRDGNLFPEQMKFADIIYNSSKELMVLLNDILDLSKIESGKFELTMEEVRLQKIVDHINEIYQYQAKEKGIYLNVLVENYVPEYIRADYQKLIQILRNLVSNAIKFTEKGGVDIVFSYDDPGISGVKPYILVSVKDTGIGIPTEAQKAIFTAFRQADTNISKQYGGTGLGLSISLKLAKKMNGDLTVISRRGEGAVFTLKLPDMKRATRSVSTEHQPQKTERKVEVNSEKPGETKPAKLQPDEYLSGKRILVVDDDARNLFITGSLLEKCGMTIIQSLNGPEALELLGENPCIDLILMDLMMPKMDGYETIRNIRQMETYKEIPIIALTADAMSGVREKCIAAGANDYVTKPFDLQTLLKSMRSFFTA